MKTIKNIPRVMIVGTGSNSGKTTITCGILKALKNKGLTLSSFKCGPDYIDPMFHSKVIGTHSRNLDLFMCGENSVKYLLNKNSEKSDFSIIEGVMGMYDGLGMSDEYSSNHLALVTETPEILIVNGRGKSISILAEISGYLNFKKNNIKGVILNNISEGMYSIFKKAIEEELKIEVFGFLPPLKDVEFKSRHLGLITANEIEDIQVKMDILAEACEKNIDLKKIIELGHKTVPVDFQEIKIEEIIEKNSVRIGIASDNAFSFYYEDNIELLKELGAELVCFSPLKDEKIPENLSGIIFGGGYPEEYGELLKKNVTMIESIRESSKKGTIIYGECGGYMYLCNSLEVKNNEEQLKKELPMVGLINSKVSMGEKLVRFGYIELIAQKDNIFCKKDETIKAHEFHYSDSTDNGNIFLAQKASGKKWECIHMKDNIIGGYPHIHFWGNIQFAKNFIYKCKEIKK